MCDRRTLLLAALLLDALLGAPVAVRAQTVDELRLRSRLADSAVASADKRQRELSAFGRFDGDGEIRAGGRVVRYRNWEVTPGDSARIAAGLELGRARLIARVGPSGAALLDTATWAVTRGNSRLFGSYEIFPQRSPNERVDLTRPILPSAVADYVLGKAGDRLTATTPALSAYQGWAAFLPERVPADEIARRLATSWAAAGRRCAARAIASCKVVLAPFDPGARYDRYFDLSDMRAVVTAARLPAFPDSAFSAARRECLRGTDSVCTPLIGDIVPANPFDGFTRASLLTHALALGGTDALGRLAAGPDAPPLAVLARVAGLSEDALIESWHAEIFASVRGRSGIIPAVLTTLLWCALFLFVSLRRRSL